MRGNELGQSTEETASGSGVGATLWSWGEALYRVYGWAVGSTPRRDPEDSFFPDDDDEAEAGNGASATDPAPAATDGGRDIPRDPARTATPPASPVPPPAPDVADRPAATNQPTPPPPPAPTASTAPATSAASTAPVTPTVPTTPAAPDPVGTPAAIVPPPAPDLASVRRAAKAAQPEIMWTLHASGDAALGGVVRLLHAACTAAPVDPSAVDRLLRQALDATAALRSQIDAALANVERREAGEKAEFGKLAKIFAGTPNGNAREKLEELRQAQKVAAASIAAIKLRFELNKDSLNLGAIGDQLDRIRTLNGELRAMDPQEVVPEVDETAPVASNVARLEYPFGGPNTIPHIHKYGDDFHLKYLDATSIKRLNLVQKGVRYENNIADALAYADGYNSTPGQRALRRVLDALL